MFDLKVKKSIGAKSNKEYVVLYVDLGYAEKAITFKITDIAEMLHKFPDELQNELELNKPIKVGQIGVK